MPTALQTNSFDSSTCRSLLLVAGPFQRLQLTNRHSDKTEQ